MTHGKARPKGLHFKEDDIQNIRYIEKGGILSYSITVCMYLITKFKLRKNKKNKENNVRCLLC